MHLVSQSLPRATLAETLGVVADVLVPNVAKGPIIRRRAAVALAERFGLDRRAVRLRDGVPRLLGPARLDAARPLPGTLDHFALRFAW